MATILAAPTLDEALKALSDKVKHNEENLRRTLVFCEDRLTLLSERAILDSVGGTFLCDVTTFARFLSGEKVLSKEGSVAVLSFLLSEYASELTCFKKSAAQAVYETIAQLSASKVDAALLREGAEGVDGILRGKLLDLAFLLEKYNDFLKGKQLLDENGYLALLPKVLNQANLQDTDVVFFAFSSFTRQAQAGIEAAILNARSVTGIFLAGKEGIYTNEAVTVFHKIASEIEDVKIIERAYTPRCEAAGIVLKNLFVPKKVDKKKTNSVFRFTAADETEELRVVAALIKKAVFEGARYSDIGVLVAGKECFYAVEQVFSSFGIPFYADKKRPFSEHPFCAFTAAVLTAVADGALPESVDTVLSSVYFGNGDEYRNYLLKFGGYRGAVKKPVKEGDAVKHYNTKLLSECRTRLLACLDCFPQKGKGSAFIKGVEKLYKLCGAEEITEGMQTQFPTQEREFFVLAPLFEVLEEIELVAGGHAFTAREFCTLLYSALSAREISLLPQSTDSVFVGDACESKISMVKYLFATGLTDALPRTSQDTAMISDGEIERLSKLKVEIEPAIAQVNARARESLALNLCGFWGALFASYPLRRGNDECMCGQVIEDLERMFDLPPMPDLFPFDCSALQQAKLQMLALKNAYEAGYLQDSKKASALYEALEELGANPARLIAEKKHSVSEAGELYFARPVSPTMLEKYFACPYAGFAMQGLRLREREERTVLDTDAGTFVHEVLQTVADKFQDFQSEEELRKEAKTVSEELLKSPRYAALLDTKAGQYTGERLIREGIEVSAAAYRQMKLSSFTVKKTEGALKIPEIGLEGKADRIDVSDEYVRIIDYKTGRFDDAVSAYYMGKKLQLPLYLRAAASEGKPAGAFYFPAADDFVSPDGARFVMSGFFSGEDEVVTRLDRTLEEGQKSAVFEGTRGKFGEKSMRQEDFEGFLDYSVLLSKGAETEMKEGNLAPSPHTEACDYCKLKSLCGFVGTPRKKESIKCAELIALVKKEKGEA